MEKKMMQAISLLQLSELAGVRYQTVCQIRRDILAGKKAGGGMRKLCDKALASVGLGWEAVHKKCATPAKKQQIASVPEPTQKDPDNDDALYMRVNERPENSTYAVIDFVRDSGSFEELVHAVQERLPAGCSITLTSSAQPS